MYGPTLVLQETTEYYNHNHDTVYCTLLYATEAFDRIHYCKLFRKLLDRKLPTIIIQYLLNITHISDLMFYGVGGGR